MLGEIEDNYRAIFNAVDDCIFVHDIKTGRILDVNKKGCEVFGYTKDEVLRIHLDALSADEPQYSSGKILELLNKTAKGKPQLFEWKCKDKAGRLFWVEINLKPSLIGDRKCLLAVMRDITERKQSERALQESNEKYRLLVENIPIHFGITDGFGTIQMWNHYAEKMLGYKADEVIGKVSAVVLHESEEDAKEVFRGIDEKGIYDKEINLVHKNGKMIPVHLVVIPEKNGKGDVIGFYGFAEDITERKRAQEALIKSEEQYRLLVENIDLGIVLIDKDYNIIMANSTQGRYFRKSVEEFVEKKCFKEFEKNDRPCQHCPGRISMMSGREAEVQSVYVRDDGSRFPVRIRTFPSFGMNGEIGGFIHMGEDITKFMQMEKALQDSETKYQSIFETTGTATSIVDEDTTVCIVNTEFEKLSGYSKKEVEGKMSWTELFAGEYLNRMKKYHYLRRRETDSAPKIYESKLINRDGSVRDVLLTVDMIPGTKRSVSSILDITEQKQAWEKLLNYQDQLRYLASQLSLAEERERRRIANDLHDVIGHSLALCKIKLEALQEKFSLMEVDKYLNEIHGLIEEMIQDTRSLIFQISPPILYELGLEEALEWLVEQTQEQQGVVSEFEDDGQVKPLEDDVRVILFQAVRELLVNIAKHSHASKAKIVTKRDGDSMRIEVKDDGIGFDICRVNSGINKNYGFGIFNIRERLKYIGGCFDIESKNDCGTCVTLIAPLKNNEQIK